MELSNAYNYCREKAFGHYENFPVASVLMPKEQADAIAAVYAFARQADDYADEPDWEGQRLSSLNHWQSLLREPGANPVFVALVDACRRYALPIELFEDLLAAFRYDVVNTRYRSMEQVLEYCRLSANPIGRLVLRIAGQQNSENDLLSDKICTGLQLANFWQDIKSDFEVRDRIYLPSEQLRLYGVNEAMLRENKSSAGLRRCILEQVAYADSLFSEGEALVEKLTGRLAWEVGLTLEGGRQILNRIRHLDYDTLAQRPVLGKRDWLSILFRLLRSRI